MSEPAAGGRVSLREIFTTFLVIGATSFGGGVVAYLRQALVVQRGWLDDDQFMSALEISQTLPGLNATNMSVLVGSRLRGVPGSTVALVGMCLPGSILLFILGTLYGQHNARPGVIAALNGVAAAATGLLLATTYQLGRKELGGVGGPAVRRAHHRGGERLPRLAAGDALHPRPARRVVVSADEVAGERGRGAR